MAKHRQCNHLPIRLPVNNDIRGLIDSVNDGTTSAFMWEWFTTKPFQDAGEVRFVRLFVQVFCNYEHTLNHKLDWFSPDTVGIMDDSCPSCACFGRSFKSIPFRTIRVCARLRRSGEERKRRHRIHTQSIWLSER